MPFTFPSNPADGQTTTNPDSNVVYTYVTPPGKWVTTVNDASADFVNVTGDTMTGVLQIFPEEKTTAGALNIKTFSSEADNYALKVRDNNNDIFIHAAADSTLNLTGKTTTIAPSTAFFTPPNSGQIGGLRIRGPIVDNTSVNNNVIDCIYYGDGSPTRVRYFGGMVGDNDLVDKAYVDQNISDGIANILRTTGGTIYKSGTANQSPNGNLVIWQDPSDSTSGRLYMKDANGTNLSLFSAGGIDMKGALSFTSSNANKIIRAYNHIDAKIIIQAGATSETLTDLVTIKQDGTSFAMGLTVGSSANVSAVFGGDIRFPQTSEISCFGTSNPELRFELGDTADYSSTSRVCTMSKTGASFVVPLTCYDDLYVDGKITTSGGGIFSGGTDYKFNTQTTFQDTMRIYTDTIKQNSNTKYMINQNKWLQYCIGNDPDTVTNDDLVMSIVASTGGGLGMYKPASFYDKVLVDGTRDGSGFDFTSSDIDAYLGGKSIKWYGGSFGNQSNGIIFSVGSYAIEMSKNMYFVDSGFLRIQAKSYLELEAKNADLSNNGMVKFSVTANATPTDRYILVGGSGPSDGLTEGSLIIARDTQVSNVNDAQDTYVKFHAPHGTTTTNCFTEFIRPVVLPSPTATNHGVTKGYVDSALSSLGGSVGGDGTVSNLPFVKKDGDTMTNHLYIKTGGEQKNALAILDASNSQYAMTIWCPGGSGSQVKYVGRYGTDHWFSNYDADESNVKTTAKFAYQDYYFLAQSDIHYGATDAHYFNGPLFIKNGAYENFRVDLDGTIFGREGMVPTIDRHIANKKYVDDNSGAVALTSSSVPTASNYTTGQIVWSTTSKTLFIKG